jgi:type VI secretion system secreted protein VgrG
MTPNERSIKLTTSWLPEGVLLLEHATLTEELGRPFEFHLDLLSTKKDLAVRDAMWSGMSISVDLPASLNLPTGGTRYFNGYVTSFARGEFRGEYTRYRATLRPWFWLLSRVSDCRIFQNMTVPEIVKKVCSDLGFDDVDASLLHETYRTLEYVVQYRETSFNFISRLMEQEGIYYFFRHTKEGLHILVLAESAASHVAVKGYETVTYLPPEALQQGSRGGDEHIARWQVSRQVQALNFTLDDFNFETPRAGLRVNVPANIPADEDSGDAFELYDYPGLYGTAEEGNKVVKLMMEERRAQVERATGGGNARGLTAGALFKLGNYTVDDQNKEYLILSTTCTLTPNVFESGTQTPGPEFDCSFVAMDSQRPFRTARKTPKPVVQGPQTAIVVGEDKEEITTDKYGRVRVQFNWDRVGTFNQDSSCWVRVAQVWAGQAWGAMHIPRIGQEVIVEFLEGDPDRPIITGRVYNFDNMPPYKLPDNKTQSGIKSRSTKGGGPSNFNEIRFEDKKGSEEFHIQAEKDYSALVKANQSITVGGDRTLSVTGKETITITKKEKQVYKDEREMTVAQTDTETITGKHTGTYNGGRELIVEKFDDTTVNSANKNTTVHGQFNITADEHFKVAQGKNQLYIKDQVYVESVGEIQLKNDKGHLDMAAGKFTVTSSDEITLTCGSASISLKKDGTIEIKGIKTTVIGSSEVDVNGGTIKLNG